MLSQTVAACLSKSRLTWLCSHLHFFPLARPCVTDIFSRYRRQTPIHVSDLEQLANHLLVVQKSTATFNLVASMLSCRYRSCRWKKHKYTERFQIWMPCGGACVYHCSIQKRQRIRMPWKRNMQATKPPQIRYFVRSTKQASHILTNHEAGIFGAWLYFDVAKSHRFSSVPRFQYSGLTFVAGTRGA